MTRQEASGLEAIGIDVGGTKIAAVRIAADGTLLARGRRDTPAGPADALVNVIADLVAELRTDRVSAVGAGLPGIVDATTGALAYAPNLGFERAPLQALLEQALALPVVTDNDANAAAWAEYRLGAGRGHDHLVLVTVGTGLGSGMIVAGRLLRGAHGFAAEVSHLILDPEGWPCACGKRGCWRVVATGRTITRLGREIALDSGEAVTQAARQGDDRALEILTKVGWLLGRGLGMLANLLDPSIIIVGGGPSEAGELLMRPAREGFASELYARADRPAVPLVRATFGNDAGALGAALLALDRTGIGKHVTHPRTSSTS